MALASYSDLRSAVANWLARSGDATLTPVIPDFITMAEQRLNRDLRLRAMETRDAALAISSSYTALPSGFIELRAIRLNTSPATPLRLVAPEWIDSSYAGSQAGRPRVFSILAGQVRVAPAPDASVAPTDAHADVPAAVAPASDVLPPSDAKQPAAAEKPTAPATDNPGKG